MTVLMCVFVTATATGTEEESDHSWDRVIDAIIEVESKGDDNARNGRCVGPMQVAPVLVRECNSIMRKRKSRKRFNLGDRFSRSKSKEMFLIIQHFYNPGHSVDRAARIWNGGPKFSVKSTNGYCRKVMSALNKKKKK